MGFVKRALEKGERRLEQSYPLYTEHGVVALLNNIHVVWSEVYKGNYDALIMLLDLEQALDDAVLTDRQLMAIDLVFFKDMTLDQAAAIMCVGHRRKVSAHIEAATKKISKYLGETEGYEDGAVC